MDNFWKIFATLFGIGAAVAFAKSLKMKQTWKETFAEMIITGMTALGAALILIFYPNTPLIAVVGLGAILSVIGVQILSKKVEEYLDKAADKFLKKEE